MRYSDDPVRARAIGALREMYAAMTTTGGMYGKVLEKLSATSGRGGTVWFVGIGKSSLLASRVAATWCSLCITSRAEDATSMLHGGLGGVMTDDCVIIISKSGGTAECKLLAEHLTRLGVMHLWASVDQNSDIPVPYVREADEWDIVPTNTLALTGVILDAIGLELACSRGFTREHFIASHPGGTIGATP